MPKQDETYTYVGTSVTKKGNRKMRFTSDIGLRVKRLIQNGDTEIDLVPLPKPMQKLEASRYLLSSTESDDLDTVMTISDAVERLAEEA